MRLAAGIALILAACQPGSDDAFPIAPGGDDSPISPARDAPPADGTADGGPSLEGRVCVVTDLRNLTSCTTGDAAGIMVALGTSTAITSIDGSFTIAPAPGANLVWSVTGAGFIPSVVPLGTVHLLPIVSAARYDLLLLDNGIVLQAEQGSLFARVIRDAAPAVGATADTVPTSVYGARYDGASGVVWDQDATAAAGVVWFPDALQGTTRLTVTAPSATPVIVSLPTTAGAITFATVGIP